MTDAAPRRTAAVVYRSHTGRTRRYGEEIAAYLGSRDIATSVSSIGDCDLAELANVDYLLLGCWTNGLFVVLQHPDAPFEAFARDLPRITRAQVGLFTTYLLVTGSMFGRMRAVLSGKVPVPGLELKSRRGRLSDRDRQALDRFIASR
jgi:hypothetical protein